MKIHLAGANLFFSLLKHDFHEKLLRCLHAPNVVKKNSMKCSVSKVPSCQTISGFGGRQTVGCVIEGLSRL